MNNGMDNATGRRLAAELRRIARMMTAAGELGDVYQVWSIDCWGNQEDGWDFNDRSKAWTFECDSDEDAGVKACFEQSLKDHGMSATGLEYDWYDYDNGSFQVNDAATGEYLWQVEKTQDVLSNSVVSRKRLRELASGALFDDLEYVGEWDGMDAYSVNTNGNDHLYKMVIYADDNSVYYESGTLTDDDVEADPENYEAELDGYKYKYDDYPFDLKAFEKWIGDRVDRGIEEGAEAGSAGTAGDVMEQLKSIPVGQSVKTDDGKDVFKLEIPEWALPYLVNDDPSGLTDEEIKMADDWWQRNNVEYVETTDERSEFTRDPEFGDACATTVCYVGIR